MTSSSWMSQRPLKCNMARPDSSYPRCLSGPPPNLRKSIQKPRNARVISLSHSAYQIHHHIPSILFLNYFTTSFMSLLFTATTKSKPPSPFTWTMATPLSWSPHFFVCPFLLQRESCPTQVISIVLCCNDTSPSCLTEKGEKSPFMKHLIHVRSCIRHVTILISLRHFNNPEKLALLLFHK